MSRISKTNVTKTIGKKMCEIHVQSRLPSLTIKISEYDSAVIFEFVICDPTLVSINNILNNTMINNTFKARNRISKNSFTLSSNSVNPLNV